MLATQNSILLLARDHNLESCRVKHFIELKISYCMNAHWCQSMVKTYPLMWDFYQIFYKHRACVHARASRKRKSTLGGL